MDENNKILYQKFFIINTFNNKKRLNRVIILEEEKNELIKMIHIA